MAFEVDLSDLISRLKQYPHVKSTTEEAEANLAIIEQGLEKSEPIITLVQSVPTNSNLEPSMKYNSVIYVTFNRTREDRELPFLSFTPLDKTHKIGTRSYQIAKRLTKPGLKMSKYVIKKAKDKIKD